MNNNSYQETEINDLLIKYLTGSASLEEQSTVKNWLNEGDDHKLYFDQLREIYFLGKVTPDSSGFDKNKSLERIKSKYYETKYKEINIQPESGFFDLKTIISIAAVFIFAIGIGYFIRSSIGFRQPVQEISSIVYNEVVTPKGSRTHIFLPDGTQVWLNANSSIKYPMDFLKGDRNVILSGEAYFDVAKDPQKRFIVQTSDLAIKVYGTKFNIKAYPDENTIQTTLEEGSVSIHSLKDPSVEKETYLKPNQSAIYYKTPIETSPKADQEEVVKPAITTNDSMLVEKEVKTILYTSWKDKKWIIESQTLEQFAIELERRYNVIISFNDEIIKSYRFNGILADETFEQVLNAIKLSAPIDYEVIGNKVLLKDNARTRNNYNKFLKRKIFN